MKKVVLSALLLAAVAVSASAENYLGSNGVTYSGPTRNAPYQCFYTNYNGAAMDEGISYTGPCSRTRTASADRCRGEPSTSR